MPNNSTNVLKDSLDRRSKKARRAFSLRVIENCGWSLATFSNKLYGRHAIKKLEAEEIQRLDKTMEV